jgi:hypothetical protein
MTIVVGIAVTTRRPMAKLPPYAETGTGVSLTSHFSRIILS